MMSALPDEVHYCCIGNTAILLDLRKGQTQNYLALSPELTEVFLKLLSGHSADAESEGLLAKFLTTKSTASLHTSASHLALPSRSLWEDSQTQVQPAEILRASLDQILAEFAFSSHSLGSLLKGLERKLRRARSNSRPLDPSHLQKAVAAFSGAAKLIPIRDRCVSRSLAMVKYLSRYATPPTFVIGVRLNPFSAHAWVQHDGIILNDELDTVRQFTPIMVI